LDFSLIKQRDPTVYTILGTALIPQLCVWATAGVVEVLMEIAGARDEDHPAIQDER
jgi:hypothetical protein